MTTIDLKTQIEHSIMAFSQGNLCENGIRLLKSLGYESDRQVIIEPNTFGGFAEIHPPLANINKKKALVENWIYIDILFQLTGEDLKQMTQGHLIFNKSRIDNQIIESYLFLTIELKPGDYSRTKLADVTREVNKFFAMPVMILFKTGNTLTLSIINRRLSKRDESKDVLEKVTLIKDINILNPIRAHIEILFDLSMNQLKKDTQIKSFVDLYNSWQKVLDTSVLNKKFYREIADWYFYAIEHVEFPSYTIADREKRNSTNVIRLITRLIFVWFIKEKGLVPKELFDDQYLHEILNYQDSQNSTYYKAILQNLFFATLNTEMGSDRRFRGKNQSGGRDAHYGITNVYRYEDYFKQSEKILAIFASIPFLNGGLFECLDKPDENGKMIRVDGFSDDKRNQPTVPDDLFFGKEVTVDLSNIYGDQTHNKEKVRGLIHIFNNYKFTIEENTPLDEEIALDPELLGKVFENLLAAYNPETGITARKQTGSFYTPREIVNFMVDESLIGYFKTKFDEKKVEIEKTSRPILETQPSLTGECQPALPVELGNELRIRELLAYDQRNHKFSESEVRVLIEAVDSINVLDPACGSGAFPMGVLHKLVFILKKLDPDNNLWREVQLNKAIVETEEAYRIGEKEERKQRLLDINEAFENNASDYGRKLFLIENCIYGVDIQPIAVQIAKLRFFISLVVDQMIDQSKSNLGIRPLPNLESKFVAADTLFGIDKSRQMFRNPVIDEKENLLAEVRDKLFYARTSESKRKYRAQDKQLRDEITTLLKSDGWSDNTATQLAKWDPFDQNISSDFFDSEWMFGIENGFDIILGNPPYIQLQSIHEKANLLQDLGFQTFKRTGDIYCLFYEKGIQLLRNFGILTFITSNKWMRAGYGEALRNYFAEKTNPLLLVDFAGQKVFESATVDVNIIVIEKAKNQNATRSCVISDATSINNLSVFVDQHSTVNNFSNRQSWSILSNIEQRIKGKIEEIGVPLKDWDISINRGVLTGFNEAFIIDGKKKLELLSADPKSAEIIRPILRGRDIKRYGYDLADLWLINTHNGIINKGIPRIEINDYPAIKNHLDIYYGNLEKRYDKGDTPYNLRSCDYWDDFYKQKIVWGNLCLSAQYAIAEEGIFINAPSSMIVPGNEALLAILNSKLADWFIRTLGVTRNGGYFEYKPMFVKKLPIPILEIGIQQVIKKQIQYLYELKKSGKDTSMVEEEIDETVFNLYGLSEIEKKYIMQNKTLY